MQFFWFKVGRGVWLSPIPRNAKEFGACDQDRCLEDEWTQWWKVVK